MYICIRFCYLMNWLSSNSSSEIASKHVSHSFRTPSLKINVEEIDIVVHLSLPSAAGIFDNFHLISNDYSSIQLPLVNTFWKQIIAFTDDGLNVLLAQYLKWVNENQNLSLQVSWWWEDVHIFTTAYSLFAAFHVFTLYWVSFDVSHA